MMRFLVGEGRVTTAEAIQRLNDDVFGGENRGLALTIYNNDVHWRERTVKLELFSKIAEAVGLDHARAEPGPAFPAVCFQVLKRTGGTFAGEARRMSATQEAGFGPQRIEKDGEGHRVPIDESS